MVLPKTVYSSSDYFMYSKNFDYLFESLVRDKNVNKLKFLRQTSYAFIKFRTITYV
jgi:hypothetical protein